jgi:hypothetical protein
MAGTFFSKVFQRFLKFFPNFQFFVPFSPMLKIAHPASGMHIFWGIASLVFTFFSYTAVLGQRIHEELLRPQEIDRADSGKVWLQVENLNLLRNNEYFSPFAEGFTLIGYFLQPRLVYQPTSRLRIEAGTHLLFLAGTDRFSQVLPVFTVQYTLAPGVTLVLGTLHGALAHRQIEPLFQFDRHFTEYVENGVQLLVKRGRWEADTWLDWDQSLFDPQNTQELFLYGTTQQIALYAPEARHRWHVHAQWLGTHRGGQGIQSGLSVVNQWNAATGLSWCYQPSAEKRLQWKAEGYYLLGNNATDISPQQGAYLFGGLASKWVEAYTGYWWGNNFGPLLGEPNFSSFPLPSAQEVIPSLRRVVTAKVFLRQQLRQGAHIGFRNEFFYDTRLNRIDFSQTLFLVFRQGFFFNKKTN